MVYFIRPRTEAALELHRLCVVVGRPIKIGSAVNPEVRLNVLNDVYRRDDLVLLGVIPGGMGTEISLHQRFDHSRISFGGPRGDAYKTEWFRPHPILLDFIAENARPIREAAEMPIRISVPTDDRFLMVVETAGVRNGMTTEEFIKHAVLSYLEENQKDAWPFKFF